MRERLSRIVTGLLVLWILALSARADMVEVWWKVDNAIQEQDWAKGEEIIERLFVQLGHRTQLVPQAFGPLYFKKGWCELKQEKWEEAARSFETCYKKFPDRRTNRYHLESLRCWADAAFAMENWELALRLYHCYGEALAAVNGSRW